MLSCHKSWADIIKMENEQLNEITNPRSWAHSACSKESLDTRFPFPPSSLVYSPLLPHATTSVPSLPQPLGENSSYFSWSLHADILWRYNPCVTQHWRESKIQLGLCVRLAWMQCQGWEAKHTRVRKGRAKAESSALAGLLGLCTLKRRRSRLSCLIWNSNRAGYCSSWRSTPVLTHSSSWELHTTQRAPCREVSEQNEQTSRNESASSNQS